MTVCGRFMQDYYQLLHHCCYCRYGAAWRKPTSFWIRNFTWADPLMCTPSGGVCDAVRRHGAHGDRVGGSASHSMQEKWHVPHRLCVELLTCMKQVRPNATWFITLFGGAASFTAPCREVGLFHIAVSYDRPSNMADEGEGAAHIYMDLSRFRLADVLDRVWAMTGLHARDLLGIGSHPGAKASLPAWGGAMPWRHAHCTD